MTSPRSQSRPTTSTSSSSKGAAQSPEAIARLDASTNLAEREKAAIRYADRYRRDEVGSDELFDELRRFFSDEEIIELGVLCSIHYIIRVRLDERLFDKAAGVRKD